MMANASEGNGMAEETLQLTYRELAERLGIGETEEDLRQQLEAERRKWWQCLRCIVFAG